MGHLIVIDGLDGSGKETQSLILEAALKARGIPCRTVSFPRYECESSALVRLYLSGGIGERPDDTGAYAASAFYACDRYISYKSEWGEFLSGEGNVVIANRYTTANAVHQLSKLPQEEWDAFLGWLWDFEFAKLGLPAPDEVLYLEVTPDISAHLVASRSSETGRKMDIHELDDTFAVKSYRAALYASDKLGWSRIRCYDGGALLPREEIAAMIWEKVTALLDLD